MKKDNKKALYESIMKTVSAQVKKALNESNDGWNDILSEFPEIEEVLSDIYDLQYELKNCVRGAYTNCDTYDELAQHMHELADALHDAAAGLEGLNGPVDELDEDEDDSWSGPYETEEERAQREEDERAEPW